MSDTITPSTGVYLASFGALLGALSMGLALGYTAPAFFDMDKNRANSPLDTDPTKRDSEKSLIGSMLAIGALVGGFLGEPCNKMFGRRISLIIYGFPFVVGWILMATAKGVAMLVAGRLLTGLCCGLASGTAPTYVVEIAPPSIRGLLGTCFQVMVVIGILLEAVFGTFMSWQVLAGWSLIPAIGMSVIMFFMPETPQWLLGKGRTREAEASLQWLRSSPMAQELVIMTRAAQQAQQTGGGGQYSLEMITSREFYKPLFMALGLMFFQQFSGINAVLFYQTDIFAKASPSSNAATSTIYVCLAQVVMTLAGSFLVDRLGRRVLLVVSGAGHAVSLVAFGFYSYKSVGSQDFQTQFAWLALTSLIVFISSFSLGFGPVPWMMIPEFSNPRVRSLVASIATAFNWTCVYIVTASVKPLMNILGDATTYWMFAVICVISCVFVVLVLPETKGKSSEQIQTELFGAGEPSQQSYSRTQDEPMKTLA